MKVPEEIKIEPNHAVVFKKYFTVPELKHKCNAVAQLDDGTLIFFDTDAYHMEGVEEVLVKGDKND